MYKNVAVLLCAAAILSVGGLIWIRLPLAKIVGLPVHQDKLESKIDNHTSLIPQEALHPANRVAHFVDVARYSGLKFKHYTGTKGIMTILETTGSGCAFCDYDNDDYLDIYIVNGSDIWGLMANLPNHPIPRNALYHNNGDGTFTNVTNESGVGDDGYGWGCVWGDYDNDGDDDLYVTNFGRNKLYQNNGNGTFRDITDQAGIGDNRLGASCAFADYDNDGDLDLYVTNYADYTLDGLQLCKERDVDTCCPPYVYNAQQDILYRNNGDGTFTDVTKEAGVFHSKPGRGLGVAFADYDNDGDFDFYVANDTTKNFLYRNNGDGTFSDVASELGVAFQENGFADSGMGVDFGDYDNDGHLDIFVANFQDYYNTLYHNEGSIFTELSNLSGLARPSLNYLTFGTAFVDYNNDGWLDVFMANGHVNNNIEQFHDTATYKQRNQLFKNNHDGTFTEVSAISGSGLKIQKASRGAAFGDYDNDGDIDILVSNSDDAISLLRNDLHSPKYSSEGETGAGLKHYQSDNSLTIRVVGVNSNRSAIGTRVRIATRLSLPNAQPLPSGMDRPNHSDMLYQIRDVRTGTSYLSDSDHRLHFGLGPCKVVDMIEVRWPSGHIKRLKNVKANQLLIIREDQ